MVRSPSIDKNGIRRGEWSKEEDDKLKAYINRYGIWNWRQLPQFAGLSRCGKSCRLRWKNYLQPNVKRGNYTKEEEDIIINMHHQLGNKWSIIARKLPGRTDNEIKNYWHTLLKKRITQGQNLTLPSNQEKMGSDCQIFETMTEEINKESSRSDNYHNKISTPSTEGSPNESCCSELSQSYWDANLSTDLFSWVRNNDVKSKPIDTSADHVSQPLSVVEDYELAQGSLCSELSFSCSDAATSSDLMAWIGEDTTTITPTSFECLDDFWSQAPFDSTDFYLMNIVNKQQQPLLDHGLVCPSSPEEVFLWSYD